MSRDTTVPVACRQTKQKGEGENVSEEKKLWHTTADFDSRCGHCGSKKSDCQKNVLNQNTIACCEWCKGHDELHYEVWLEDLPERWLSSEAAAQLAEMLLSKTGRCIRCGGLGTEINCCNVGKVRGVLRGAGK